jgi:uncharacterized protein
VRIILLLALALSAIPPAFAQDALPKNDGWVTDLAGFLTPQQEQSLERLMQSYETGSGNEIALLTVPDLGGKSLEGYALDVARGWKIGEKDLNNGALLLIAREERKIRIEVGRGLEGNLTDSISGRIIRNVITPQLKQGRLYEGLRAGVEAMHAAAGGDYAAIPKDRGRHSRRSSGIGIVPLIFFIFLISRLFGRRGGPRGGGSGILPWLLLGSMASRGSRSSGWHGGIGGGGFGGFGGGGGFSGGGASGGW